MKFAVFFLVIAQVLHLCFCYNPGFGIVPFSYSYKITGKVENVMYRSLHSASDYEMMTCFIAMQDEADEPGNRRFKYHSCNSEAMCRFAERCYLADKPVVLYAKTSTGDNHAEAIEFANTKAKHWNIRD